MMKEKPGGYDEPACIQAFDALTTHLAIFATRCTILEKLCRRTMLRMETMPALLRCSDHYNVFPVCQIPMEEVSSKASWEGFREPNWPQPRNPGKRTRKPDISQSKKTLKLKKRKPTDSVRKKTKPKRKKEKKPPSKKSKVEKKIEKIKKEIKNMNRKKSKNKKSR